MKTVSYPLFLFFFLLAILLLVLEFLIPGLVYPVIDVKMVWLAAVIIGGGGLYYFQTPVASSQPGTFVRGFASIIIAGVCLYAVSSLSWPIAVITAITAFMVSYKGSLLVSNK